MTNLLKLVIGSLVFILAFNNTVLSQNKELKWGLYVPIKGQEISHVSDNEELSTINQQPIGVGAFIEYNKFNVDVDFLVNTASFDVKYFFLDKAYFTLKANWDKHEHELYNWEGSYYASWIDDINFYSYFGGVGYQHTLLNRLKCQGSFLGGIMHSSKKSGSDMIYYNSNLRARKNDTYQLKPTFVFGGAICFELLTRPSKNRIRPITPFISFGLAGTTKSRVYRKVSVEEWVEGNVVYTEELKAKQKLYDLEYIDFRIGLRLYIKK